MATTATEVINSADSLLSAHSALLSRVRASQRLHRRQLKALPSPPEEITRLPLLSSAPASRSPSPQSSPLIAPKAKPNRADLPPAKRARVARYNNYIPEEETIRNDYSQRYVDGGEWPQNWVLGAEPEHRFEEYPKQQRLLNLKKTSVTIHALPPSYLPFQQLPSIHPCKFDAILIDPPFSSSFGWEQLQEIPIPALAADPSFVFLWVGSGAGEGLERGRDILAKWGYRRCEDVVWVKTNNTSNQGPGTDPPTTSLLTRTKQHCLIGIRGTVRRSTDSWFVHCNVDTDVIIWEGDATDPTRKPPEMYTLIENFCLGTRRLEIFGRARSSLRRGWVTVLAEGEEERISSGLGMDVDGDYAPWDKDSWENGIRELANGGKCVVPMTPEIDALRPKSPFRGGSTNNNGGGNMGMGRGSGGFNPNPRGGGFMGGPQSMMVQPMGMVGGGGMGAVGGGGMGGMGGSGGMNAPGVAMNMGMGGPQSHFGEWQGGMNMMGGMGGMMMNGQMGMPFGGSTGGGGGFQGGQGMLRPQGMMQNQGMLPNPGMQQAMMQNPQGMMPGGFGGGGGFNGRGGNMGMGVGMGMGMPWMGDGQAQGQGAMWDGSQGGMWDENGVPMNMGQWGGSGY
ncbi:hypothetical protein PLICRDRAFT_46445 [Plicaturopsis crispa FD-325 SS-3]|uniref:MT-A70-domain-containing protein n=1 Tax=Plicaturopsis crispa FD-325 SS-3 TaxID=944288 RepID=A0A0C9SQW4_PLICR|nr:hypothetical protein PLICRDRAFT_46445 [Plicaturopsis crispa FD-325 SS-3]